MKSVYKIVLILFFLVVGCVLYLGISGNLEPLFNHSPDAPGEGHRSGFLDSTEVEL